jgi:protein involved in polysaccharide export with SLBB domain
MKYNRFLAPLAIILIWSALQAPYCYAQRITMPTSSSPENELEGIIPEKTDFSSIPVSSGKSILKESQFNSIDNSIDEATYLVGGGDVFLISSADRSNRFFSGVVNQNGDLLIPDLGVITIGKLPLKRAKEIIRDTVLHQLKNVKNITVALRKVKTVTVSVIGAVKNPGTYSFYGTLRLFDAVRAASIDLEKLDLDKLLTKCNLRAIRRKNGDSVKEFDLMAFMYKGDVSQNPYLYPGDQILVPPVTDRVFVHGEINGPWTGWGLVPIRVHDRACDVLSLLSFSQNTDTGRIELRRRDPDKTDSTLQVFALSQNPDIELANGDIITIPPKRNNTEFLIVTVEGEVVRPGTYPIKKNNTVARDVIVMAGDMTRYANLSKAVIIRRNKFTIAAPNSLEGKAAEFGEPLSGVRPELGSALSLMTSTKDFSVIRILENPNIFLETNDLVIVPRAEKTVYVSGNVRAPGGYPYVEGKDKAYYISRAGGYTAKANKSNIYLVAQYGEVRQIFDRNTVEDGDVIVVPMSQEYKRMTTIVLPVMSTMLGLLGLLVGVYATLHN